MRAKDVRIGEHYAVGPNGDPDRAIALQLVPTTRGPGMIRVRYIPKDGSEVGWDEHVVALRMVQASWADHIRRGDERRTELAQRVKAAFDLDVHPMPDGTVTLTYDELQLIVDQAENCDAYWP